MKICLDDDCAVHTYLEREPIAGCPGCDGMGSIVPCPDCLGTGLRSVPGRDKTLVCTGCEYEIDLDEEAPAFLGWVEKMTDQSNLSRWGHKETVHETTAGHQSTTEGSVRWHLDSARDCLLHASPHDLETFDAEDDLFLALLCRSLGEMPVDPGAVLRVPGEVESE